MDMVTGTQVAVTLIVPVPRKRMWDPITAMAAAEFPMGATR